MNALDDGNVTIHDVSDVPFYHGDVEAAGAHVGVHRWPSPGAREIAQAMSTHLTTVVASATGPDASNLGCGSADSKSTTT